MGFLQCCHPDNRLRALVGAGREEGEQRTCVALSQDFFPVGHGLAFIRGSRSGNGLISGNGPRKGGAPSLAGSSQASVGRAWNASVGAYEAKM